MFRLSQTLTRSAVADDDELMFVKLRYQEPGGSESRLVTYPVERIEERSSEDFRFAAAVAAWGMLLRKPVHTQSKSFRDASPQWAR